MDEGRKMSNMVEFQFAQEFDDFRDMSTMVGVTAGVGCSDVGITKEDC